MTRRSILTEAQVRQIRTEYRQGVRGFGYLALSKKYQCAESTIRDLITLRTRWAVI